MIIPLDFLKIEINNHNNQPCIRSRKLGIGPGLYGYSISVFRTACRRSSSTRWQRWSSIARRTPRRFSKDGSPRTRWKRSCTGHRNFLARIGKGGGYQKIWISCRLLPHKVFFDYSVSYFKMCSISFTHLDRNATQSEHSSFSSTCCSIVSSWPGSFWLQDFSEVWQSWTPLCLWQSQMGSKCSSFSGPMGRPRAAIHTSRSACAHWHSCSYIPTWWRNIVYVERNLAILTRSC